MPLPRESSRGRDLFGCSFQLMPLCCCSAVLRCLDGWSLVSSVAGLSEHLPGGPEGCAHPLQLSVAIRHQSWFPKLKFISFTAVGSVTPSSQAALNLMETCVPARRRIRSKKKKLFSWGAAAATNTSLPPRVHCAHTHTLNHSLDFPLTLLGFSSVFRFFLCVWLLPMHGGKFFGIPFFLFLWLMINMSLHVH